MWFWVQGKEQKANRSARTVASCALKVFLLELPDLIRGHNRRSINQGRVIEIGPINPILETNAQGAVTGQHRKNHVARSKNMEKEHLLSEIPSLQSPGPV